jgi:hypothetical protein
MTGHTERAQSAAVIPPIECTFDEAIARFYGEWVLFQIHEFDEYWEPVRGLVYAHSRDRSEISEVLKGLPSRSQLGSDVPHHPYYPFFARAVVHANESDDEARARFNQQRAAAPAEHVPARG